MISILSHLKRDLLLFFLSFFELDLSTGQHSLVGNMDNFKEVSSYLFINSAQISIYSTQIAAYNNTTATSSSSPPNPNDYIISFNDSQTLSFDACRLAQSTQSTSRK